MYVSLLHPSLLEGRQITSAKAELAHQIHLSDDGSYAVAWHPTQLWLAYAPASKDRDERFGLEAHGAGMLTTAETPVPSASLERSATPLPEYSHLKANG